MTEFFSAILSFFDLLISVVVNFVTGIASLLVYIPTAAQMLTYTIGTLPVALIGFATALIGISIAYLIIGR